MISCANIFKKLEARKVPGRPVINGPFRTFVGCNQSVPPQKGIVGGGGGGGGTMVGEGGLIWRCVGFRRHFLSQFNFAWKRLSAK